MGIFDRPLFHSSKKRELPPGLWEKCPSCGELIHNLELQQNFRVCPRCEYHFTQTAYDRIDMLLDADSFKEHDEKLASVDTLKFTGQASYLDRLKTYRKKTGLRDAVITGLGTIEGFGVGIAVLDFNFLAATMGSVVGEKLTRIIERATADKIACIIVSASGGARMYEGALSLMQMAKTCGALARHAAAKLPYISVLTHPTTGGVSASFATVGDINIAEPKAMIGFAGPRVIRETTHQDLPPNFQTAEFLQDHGLIDMIVHRKKMRQTLGDLLPYLLRGVNYREALAWLYTTQLHGVKPGLECMQRLVRELALPVDGTHGPRFIHVAGTNGKGSVCAMLESILRASGIRTGLFTSPHLVHFRERIRVAGVEIAEDAVAAGLTRIRSLSEHWERTPTFFEITTALGLLHFQQARVEIAVWETGLGGRLDATNVVTPLISVLTPIDIDHEQYLGRQLAEIALEKAGIIKPGRPAISGPQPEDVLQVLAHVAVERDSQFHLVLSPLAGVPLALAGDYQRWNAALAVHSLDAAGLTVSNEALIRGLATVRWPGRFQRLEQDQIILDGAHNLAAARQLSRTWTEMYGDEKATIIAGIMQDKDVRGICSALAPLARRFIAVRVRNNRSASAEDVLAAILELSPNCESFVAANLDDALDIAENCPERILITGSLFLVGEALALLQGERELEASLQ